MVLGFNYRVELFDYASRSGDLVREWLGGKGKLNGRHALITGEP